MKNILITGGYGNLGSWLTSYLSKRNYNVSISVSNTKSFLNDLTINVIECDITSPKDCSELAKNNYDVIFHMASANDSFVEDYADKALMVNGLGTRNLLNAFKLNPPKHFIYLSTFHVYGATEGTITEETPTLPINDYGSTHLVGEIYVKQFHKTHHIPYTIIRLTNSYGCPLDVNSSKWYLILNNLAQMAIQNEQIILKSNGKSKRDFIWMGDVCAIFEKIILLPFVTNDTYNLSAEQSYSMYEIAQAVQNAYLDFAGKYISIVVNDTDLSKPVDSLVVSSDKLKNLVEYKAESHFEEEALKIFKLLSLK